MINIIEYRFYTEFIFIWKSLLMVLVCIVNSAAAVDTVAVVDGVIPVVGASNGIDVINAFRGLIPSPSCSYGDNCAVAFRHIVIYLSTASRGKQAYRFLI